MIVYYYDKTIEGLLNVVFEAYKRKSFPDLLLGIGEVPPLFVDKVVTVQTDNKKVFRVGKLLNEKMPREILNMLNAVWLSEEDGSDLLIFKYIKKAIDSQFTNYTNFGDETVLNVIQLAKKVNKEKHFIKQFVRFQKSKDDIYFAPVVPVYNTLPLVIYHFKDRFAFQPWILYDLRRKYGFYYNLEEVIEMTLENEDEYLLNGKIKEEDRHQDDQLFQDLWKKYFKSITIKERINLKVHKQFMPRRYWKYLTEKQQ